MTDHDSKKTLESASLPEIWSSLKDRLEPGTLTTRYQVSDAGTLSVQAMEDLLDAHDIALNRRVSLKKLNLQNKQDQSKLESFIEEARLTGNLQHPNIIPVHDLVPGEDGSLFFTLRYVDGDRLETVLSKDGTPFTLNEGMTIFTKLCDAVSFAHNRDIYHKALSPDSIIIGNYGEVFVLNWGDAEKVDNGEGRLRHNDITDLGNILKAIAQKALGNTRKMPLSLEAVIRRASRPARSNYSSVDELRDDVSLFQAGHPTAAEGANPVRQLILLANRHKLESIALASALIVAATLTGWFLNRIQEQRDRTLIAAKKAENSQQLAEESAAIEQRHLVKLKALVPMLKEQITIDMKNGRPEDALERTGMALKLIDDDPGLWEQQGDLQQLLLQFEQSVGSYKKIPQTAGNRNRLQNKIRVSETYKKSMGDDTPGDNVLMALYLEMTSQNRIHEANYILKGFKEKHNQALKEVTAQTGTKQLGENILSWNVAGITVSSHQDSGELDISLSAPDHTITDLACLKNVPLSGLTCSPQIGIETLDALEGKPLLKLLLNKTEVTDLTPLANLPLQVLKMKGSRVSVLEPLKSLPLDVLSLENAPYTSLEPLRNLHLKTLDISGSNVTDLSPLNRQSLEGLLIARTPVKAIDSVQVSSLRRLRISHTAVSDLSVLAASKLEILNAEASGVADISPLKGLPLKQVNLKKTSVSDLTPLRGCPLESLTIGQTRINSLEPVADAPNLTVLDVSQLSITNIPDNNWKRLTTLNAGFSKLTNLSTLDGAPLHTANLEGTPITDISPIVNRLLTSLNLNNTPVTDLTPLAGSNIKHLNIAHTPVSDLSALATVYLSTLDVSHTPITSLKGLEKQPITELNISGTHITDLTPLKHVPLSTILLDPDRITRGLDVLKQLPTLKRLIVKGKTYTPDTFPPFKK